jgi:hypothetical protein
MLLSVKPTVLFFYPETESAYLYFIIKKQTTPQNYILSVTINKA